MPSEDTFRAAEGLWPMANSTVARMMSDAPTSMRPEGSSPNSHQAQAMA